MKALCILKILDDYRQLNIRNGVYTMKENLHFYLSFPWERMVVHAL